MKAKFVNPFIQSVYELCSTMLSCKASRTGLALSDRQKKPREVVALIGFSGSLKGTAALALPNDTCMAMVSKLLGEPDEQDEATVSDTISEFVNIIAGSAKATISEEIGEVLQLSLPIVLRGDDYEIYSPSSSVWLEVPFKTELGELTLRLSFERGG